MMKGLDNFYSKKAEIIHYWSQGMNVGKISSLTGVPQIRIAHEMDKLEYRNPIMRRLRAMAQYPSQRRKYRTAAIVVDPREQFRSVNEY